jgi:hypothetical protein
MLKCLTRCLNYGKFHTLVFYRDIVEDVQVVRKRSADSQILNYEDSYMCCTSDHCVYCEIRHGEAYSSDCKVLLDKLIRA